MQTLSRHFKALAGEAFKKHGFTQAGLLENWDTIVGEQFAAFLRPDKIKWPRPSNAQNSETAGGQLVVSAAPGRALEAQYAAPQLMDRINQFFGYRAIAAIKIIQAAKPFESRPKPITETPPSEALLHQLEAISDPALKDALARLGANLEARRKRSPQHK